jgi:hypothetical protein
LRPPDFVRADDGHVERRGECAQAKVSARRADVCGGADERSARIAIAGRILEGRRLVNRAEELSAQGAAYEKEGARRANAVDVYGTTEGTDEGEGTAGWRRGRGGHESRGDTHELSARKGGARGRAEGRKGARHEGAGERWTRKTREAREN